MTPSGRAAALQPELSRTPWPKSLLNSANTQPGLTTPGLERINLNAAGIDIGADFHWVALPPDRTLYKPPNPGPTTIREVTRIQTSI